MSDLARDPVVIALREELDALDRMVATLDETGWSRASGCAGWSIADVLLHLAQTNEMAASSARGQLTGSTTGATWAEAGSDVDESAGSAVAAERGARGVEVLERWRASADDMVRALSDADPTVRVRWVVGDMAPRTLATTRIAETWIHGGDVATGLGVEQVPTGRLRHIVHLVHRTLPFAFGRAGLEAPQPVAFELRPPAGGQPWVFGDPSEAATVVRGPALDLCLVAGQRAAASDTALIADGPDAESVVLSFMRTFA